MGTRLYVEFNTSEDEASFLGTTVSKVKETREEYKEWQRTEPDQVDERMNVNPEWYRWFKSLSKLATEVNNYDLFGLGNINFDPSEVVPDTKDYAGSTSNPQLIKKLLITHMATCSRLEECSKMITFLDSIKSITWG